MTRKQFQAWCKSETEGEDAVGCSGAKITDGEKQDIGCNCAPAAVKMPFGPCVCARHVRAPTRRLIIPKTTNTETDGSTGDDSPKYAATPR